MKKAICLILAAILLCACGGAVSWQEQYDLGMQYLNEQKYDEAVLAFKEAIQIDPKKADAYVALADVYMAQGNYEDAINILHQGQQAAEDKQKVEDKLAQIYISQAGELVKGETPEDIEKALDQYEKAEEMGYEEINIWLGMAEAYIVKGDYENALNMLKKAYEISNTDEIMKKINEIQEFLKLYKQENAKTILRYDKNQTLLWYQIDRFDAQGRKNRVEVYQADGTLWWEKEIVYHEKESGWYVEDVTVAVNGEGFNSYEHFNADGTLAAVLNEFESEEFFYDEQGRITQTREVSWTTGETYRDSGYGSCQYVWEETEDGTTCTRTTYNSEGKAYGNSMVDVFDKAGNLVRMEAYDGDTLLWKFEYQYNQDNRLIRETDGQQEVEYFYKEQGELSKETGYNYTVLYIS